MAGIVTFQRSREKIHHTGIKGQALSQKGVVTTNSNSARYVEDRFDFETSRHGVQAISFDNAAWNLQFKTAKPIVHVVEDCGIHRQLRMRPAAVAHFVRDQFLRLKIRITEDRKAGRTELDIAIEAGRCPYRPRDSGPQRVIGLEKPACPN
jgi:hypothetical protein